VERFSGTDYNAIEKFDDMFQSVGGVTGAQCRTKSDRRSQMKIDFYFSANIFSLSCFFNK
jgi:hypothetical protein